MGPSAARGFGWGRRIRTPATRARTWRPTPRRSPTKAATAQSIYHTRHSRKSAGGRDRDRPDRREERAGGERLLEHRNLRVLEEAPRGGVRGVARDEQEAARELR